MATLDIALPSGVPVCNGKQITFSAPCNCLGITDLVIEGKTYALVNSRGLSISSGDLFAKDALVTVTLDTINMKAYLQGGSESPKRVSLSGAVNLDLEDNTIYTITNVTSLNMRGASVDCCGFIKFGSISSSNLVVSGFAVSSGDDILEADVSNQLWEFNVAKSPISGESGYIIWKNWSDI